jgi:hypothetical protein
MLDWLAGGARTSGRCFAHSTREATLPSSRRPRSVRIGRVLRVGGTRPIGETIAALRRDAVVYARRPAAVRHRAQAKLADICREVSHVSTKPRGPTTQSNGASR